MAEQEAKEMTREEIEEAEIEFFIASPFLRKLNGDKEYRTLIKERNDILGIETEDISDYDILSKRSYSQDKKGERTKKKPRIISANKKRILGIKCIVLDYILFSRTQIQFSNIKIKFSSKKVAKLYLPKKLKN